MQLRFTVLSSAARKPNAFVVAVFYIATKALWCNCLGNRPLIVEVIAPPPNAGTVLSVFLWSSSFSPKLLIVHMFLDNSYVSSCKTVYFHRCVYLLQFISTCTLKLAVYQKQMVLKQSESKLPDSYHGTPTNDAALKVIEVLKANVIQKQWELVLSSIKMGEF